MRKTLFVTIGDDEEFGKEVLKIYRNNIRQRKWHSTFMDSMRLMDSLQSGQTDVLYELFPWLESQMACSPELTAIQDALVELKTIVEHVQIAAPAPMSGNLLTQHTIDMPVFDDDDSENTKVVAAVSSQEQMLQQAMNLINSAMSFQGGGE